MDASLALPVLIGLIIVALAFDFLNGLHDAANSIATIVSTRVLRPHYAVAWAAFFNFIAFLFFGLHVAQTVGVGIVVRRRRRCARHLRCADGRDLVELDHLVGRYSVQQLACADRRTGRGRRHQGGQRGGGVGRLAEDGGGHRAVADDRLLSGAAVDLDGIVAVRARHSPLGERTFRTLQFVSASLYSLGHGGNDAQKTMGIIAVLLFSQGHLGSEFYVPFWVVITCQAAMGLGTLFGGWRIVHTMGSKITRLTPMQGCCAETGGAITLFGATWLGIPVSTTHTITGAIVGVGAARKVSAVRWNIASNIVLAWVITLPASALIAASFYALTGIAP